VFDHLLLRLRPRPAFAADTSLHPPTVLPRPRISVYLCYTCAQHRCLPHAFYMAHMAYGVKRTAATRYKTAATRCKRTGATAGF